MQTNSTLLVNNSQHCWMLHVHVIACCCLLLGVVAHSLKLVKVLFCDHWSEGPCLRITHSLQSLKGNASFPRWTACPNIATSTVTYLNNYFWKQRFLLCFPIKKYTCPCTCCIIFRSILPLHRRNCKVKWCRKPKCQSFNGCQVLEKKINICIGAN